MLRNCKIVSINKLLFVICKQCNGKVVKLGGNRAAVQQRSTPFFELPEFIQRQQQEQTPAHLLYYCNKCKTHIHCRRTFLVKLNVYCGSGYGLRELAMFNDAACQFFGCEAEYFDRLSRNNKNLIHLLEDYLTERTWNITLQYKVTHKKKRPIDKIIGLVPLFTDLPNEPLIDYLAKKNILDSSTSSSSLVLDSSLCSWF